METNFHIADKLKKTAGVEDATSYTPLISVLVSTWLVAFVTDRGIIGFMGFTLVFFSAIKLMDIRMFAVEHKEFDVVAGTFEPFAYLYPFLEMFVGLAILSGKAPFIVGLVAFVVGLEGTYSIVKSAYIDGKDLRAVSLGVNSNIPIGLVSVLENVMMTFIGLWLLTFSS